MLKSSSNETCINAISFSEVSPCVEENMMARPNAEQFIDSTNPQDNPKLLPGDDRVWTSEPDAGIVVTPDSPQRVMAVGFPDGVEGAKTVIVGLERNGKPVQQVEVDTSNRVSFLNALYRLSLRYY